MAPVVLLLVLFVGYCPVDLARHDVRGLPRWQDVAAGDAGRPASAEHGRVLVRGCRDRAALLPDSPP
jgi:hypothetical protein